jgi:SAM-dependent methyltransferase
MLKKFKQWLKKRLRTAVGLPALEDREGKLLSFYEALVHDLKMPKYLYHSPLDYSTESYAPSYGKPVYLQDEELPIPSPEARPGYSPEDDRHYINWGKSDHDCIIEIIKKHSELKEGQAILDWGCSSGRVLRHFYNEEHKKLKWKLYGTDIQAFLVEWMRRYFPKEINIMCGTTIPHLPFRDSSLDFIYGISVFTHTKYLWDMWLAEFSRVLKPGGLCIQSVQCETAWKFYHENRNLDWVKNGHPESMLKKPEIDVDFFFYGDAFISQTFYKEEVLKRYWGRYMEVVDFLPPPKFSYQNWIVLKNNI